MDLKIFDGLLTGLPDLSAQIQVLCAKFPDHGKPVTAINPSPEPERPVKRLAASNLLSSRRPVPPPQDMGSKKLNAKPTSSKAKFSSITGPEINYDGDSQKILFDCWTSLNAQRGLLRKEMMQLKRKKVLRLPTADYGYDDADSDLEADDDDDDETPEEKAKREEEEQRQREEQKRKEEEDRKKTELLEGVDSFLDKASRACESAAFLWLKGEGCAGHVVYIQDQFLGAIDRVNLEKERNASKLVDDDEGFDELDPAVGDLSDEELPHKKACQRPTPEPDPVPPASGPPVV